MIHILKSNGHYWFVEATVQDAFAKRLGPYSGDELEGVLKSRFGITDQALITAMKKADATGEGEIGLL